MNILAPSILSADFADLGSQIKKTQSAGASYIHLDVMDGAFVPNISFGVPVIQAVKKITDQTLDVHLMIEEPIRYIDDFKNAGADIICVHAEACKHLDRTIMKIKEVGCKPAVALNPATGLHVLDYILPELSMVLIMSVNPGFGGQSFIPYTLDKIKDLRRICQERGLQNLDIEVDGGINHKNVKQVLDAGANVIVAGSAVFNGDIVENTKEFMRILG